MLEFLAVFTLAILPQVLVSFYPDELRDLLGRIPGNWRFLSTLPGRLGAILLVLLIASSRPDGFHTLGLTAEEAASPMTVLTAGFLTGYLLLIFVFSGLRSGKAKENIQKMQQRTLSGLRYSRSSGLWERLSYFADIWLAVIGEELVYRGYLVMLLGRETGGYLSWAIFSAALSALIHLYQGRTWRVALGHMIIAALFIAVALFTKSLFAAMVPHLVYDTVWLVRALRSKSNEETPTPQN